MARSYFDNISEFYSDSLSVEIVELQRRILLPVLPREMISAPVLHAYNDLGFDFRTAEDLYTDMVGNFYTPMIFPLVENGKSTEMEFEAPSTENILNPDSGMETKEYLEHNYINLIIPKFIVEHFRKEIPRGTKFVAVFIGGSSSINSIKIIGVSEIGELKMSPYELKSSVGMEYEEVLEMVSQDIEEANAEYEAALAEEEAEYGES